MINAILHALQMAFAMGWEILWPLILGFALSGVVQAVVSHREMSRLLPDDRPRSIAIALGLGAASSSCSYAAVALARSIFRKGANFTAAMAFEMASTNLVLELSIIIFVLLGWQFTLAEFVGAPIMVIQTIVGSDILVAAGRSPNTAGIGLEVAGVELDGHGYIKVNERLETSAPEVWAIGECAGSPQFTHVSVDDFRIIRDNLAGGTRSTRDRLVPYCMFTEPPLARVGLSEREAQRQAQL